MKDTDVDINLFFQFPKSASGDVKVTLKEPTLENNPEATLTKVNNIQTKTSVSAGKEKNFPFAFAIEYPTGKEINYP